ncbi:MAG: flagellar basal body P-ring protein FlgI [Bryobacteraceae bacterium]|jgi:flagellar P-ring protein precursor FlgI
MKKLLPISIALALQCSNTLPLRAARLKDLASIEGVRDNHLVGYGLVVGLAGRGDSQQTIFSAQSLTNLLERMGVTVSPTAIQVRNTAAVMVTAMLPPFARPGMKVDVLVSAIGDARTLQGGTLIVSPLRSLDGQVYATAQGSVVTGGFVAGGGAASKVVNHPTAGRIPEGAIVERPAPSVVPGESMRWMLNHADFTTAERIAEQINQQAAQRGEGSIAIAESSGTVLVKVPAAYHGRSSEFIAQTEGIKIDADVAARVVVNERTGTIVIGGDVTISPVSILHGSLSVEIQTHFLVSQPAPFSQGASTTVVPETSVNASEQKAKSVQLQKGATVEQLAQALLAIGATPRDIIAILQNLRASGALDAELEVI